VTKTTPFFSIVIPTYNRADLIMETIDSVLSQTFDDFEIIVVDDGSTDDTKMILEQKFNQDTRSHYYFQENSERGVARNYGVSKTQGEFIVFLDSDDMMKPEHLASLKNAIDSNPTVNLLATNFEFLQDDKLNPANRILVSPGYHTIDLALKGNNFGCNFCVRKRSMGAAPFVEERKFTTMEDWMFLLKGLENDKVLILKEETIIVRDHTQRSMKQDNRMIIEKRLSAFAWIKENVVLSSAQERVLAGHTYYFIAIHKYLGSERGTAFQQLLKAIGKVGLNARFLVLLFKILIGRKLIQQVRNATK